MASVVKFMRPNPQEKKLFEVRAEAEQYRNEPGFAEYSRAYKAELLKEMKK